MNTMDNYELFYLLSFVFTLCGSAMARLVMIAAYEYRKRKSERKKIRKRIYHPISIIFCPYSFYKPTFAPKHLLFAWILRLVNISKEILVFVILLVLKIDSPVIYVIHMVFGGLNLLFALYVCIFLREEHSNDVNLERSLFVRRDKWM